MMFDNPDITLCELYPLLMGVNKYVLAVDVRVKC